MADNLKLEQQINEALKQRQKLLEKQTAEMSRQAELSKRLKETVREIEVPDESLDNMKKLQLAMEEALETAEDQKDLHDGFFEAVEEGFDESKKGWEDWAERVKHVHAETSNLSVFIGGFISGIESWFGFLKKGLTSALSLLASAVGLTAQLGKTILALPISMFQGFVDIANSFHGGTQLRQAFEDIRKQFGDFKTGVSRDVINSAKNLRGTLEHTGLSSFRVFGLLYEKLNLVREVMTEMGPIAHQFSGEIYRNAEVVLQFQKALGFSNEAMGSMGLIANKNFTTMADMQREVANQSLQMGKRFGIDQKLIGRDISEMMQDFDNFGSVGTSAMASLSVFARKLGADFKELLGVVDQFDNFEDAAENAAKLAQSFGLNINAFEMMKEQDPGARIEKLRKQFFITGKTIEGMTRQERALLAQTTGLRGAALEATFAAKNQGLSYEEITKASKEAEKAQLTQAEALAKLANSIERLVKSGQRQGGFWSRFLQGFRRGIFWSRDFFKIIRNIKRSLWAAERAGRAVGRAFVKYFPGVKTFIQGVREFFDPATFKVLTGGVVSIFRQFFKELSSPATSAKALDRLFNNFKKVFGKMVEAETGAVGKIIGGFKKFFVTLGEVALHGIRIVMDQFADWARLLADAIEDPRPFTEALGSLFKAGEGQAKTLVQKLLGTVARILGPAWRRLRPAVTRLFKNVWGSVKKYTKDWWDSLDWGEILTSKPSFIIAGVLFGPVFLKASIGVLGNTLLKLAASGRLMKAASVLGGKLSGFFGQEMFSLGAGASTKISGWVGSLFGKAKDAFIMLGDKLGGVFGGTFGGKAVGKIAGKLAAGGAVLGAAIAGWQLGKYLDEEFDISDTLSGYKGDIDALVLEFQTESTAGKMHVKAVKNIELRNALQKQGMASIQETNKLLKEGADISAEDRVLALRTIKDRQSAFEGKMRMLFVEKMALKTIKDAHGISKLRQEDEIRFQAFLKEAVEERGFALDENVAKTLKEADAQKKLTDEMKGAAEASAGISVPGIDLPAVTVGDLQDIEDIAKKVKGKLSPKKIKEVSKLMQGPVREALLGKEGEKDGGLRGAVSAIIKDFKIDPAKVSEVTDAVLKTATIPQALMVIQREGSKLSSSDYVDAILKIEGAVPLLNRIGQKKLDFTGKDISDLSQKVYTVGTLSSALAEFQGSLKGFSYDVMEKRVGKMSKTLSMLGGEVGQYATKGGVLDLPVIKGITNMVTAVNAVSTQLNSLQEINASAKLEALGSAIGLGATGKFEIQNKPVNLTLNLEITMDAGTVGKELVKAKVVLPGPKAGGT